MSLAAFSRRHALKDVLFFAVRRGLDQQAGEQSQCCQCVTWFCDVRATGPPTVGGCWSPKIPLLEELCKAPRASQAVSQVRSLWPGAGCVLWKPRDSEDQPCVHRWQLRQAEPAPCWPWWSESTRPCPASHQEAFPLDDASEFIERLLGASPLLLPGPGGQRHGA